MSRRVLAGILAVAFVVLGAGCGQNGAATPHAQSSSSRPLPAGRIAIIAPTSGEVVHARALHVKVRLSVTSAGEPATPHAPPGWLHLYLDGKVKSIQPVLDRHGVLGHSLGDIRPGTHRLRAEFVQPDHLPWRPAVAVTVKFTVRR